MCDWQSREWRARALPRTWQHTRPSWTSRKRLFRAQTLHLVPRRVQSQLTPLGVYHQRWPIHMIICEIMVQISCTFENGSTQPCLFKSDIVQSTPPETFSERAPQLLITA